MAVRSPLYYDAGDLKEMTSSQVNEIVDQFVYQYSLNPSVSLSVVSSGGNLTAINDTRLQAGSVSTDASSFPGEGTTQEPQTVTVSYDKLNSTNASVSPTADTGKTWPVYRTASNDVQAMSLQDIKDTFLHPAIDLLTAATTTTQQAGTYTIHTTNNLAGATLVDATPIFIDTRADTSAYSAATIGDHALDNPTTITSFYLHIINGNDNAYTTPMYIRGDNDLQTYDESTWEGLMQEWIRSTAVSSSDGYSISYNIGASGAGQTRGSGITNTELQGGSGNYQTRQAGADDYRAQEFPDGTAATATTYYLRINKS